MAASAPIIHPQLQPQPLVPLRVASDKRLVALVRRGNERAFETIYERHHRPLLSYCRHMLGSREDAEDALQQTFASAARALPSDERVIELRPWLFAIARNACLSTLRKRQLQPGVAEQEPATDGLSEQVERREELRHLLVDLGRLPLVQRSALLLAEVGGLTHAQIAQILDCETQQVKGFVFQARSNLMAEREAREQDCATVREELATMSARARLKGPLRRHLRHCNACREFNAGVRDQRRALALLLPAIPSAMLKEMTMRAVWGHPNAAGATAGLTSGSGLTGGMKAALAGKAVIVKALVLAGVFAAVGGGALVVSHGLPGLGKAQGSTASSRSSALRSRRGHAHSGLAASRDGRRAAERSRLAREAQQTGHGRGGAGSNARANSAGRPGAAANHSGHHRSGTVAAGSAPGSGSQNAAGRGKSHAGSPPGHSKTSASRGTSGSSRGQAHQHRAPRTGSSSSQSVTHGRGRPPRGASSRG